MRLSALVILLGLLAAGCSGGAGAPPAGDLVSNGTPSGGRAREPMRLHALAVAVCPQPAGSPASTLAPPSQCSSQQRIDLPPLLDVPGLTPLQIPGYEPAELQAAYGLPSASAGRGQTIAIVIPYDNPHAEIDLAVYRAMFGLPPCTSLNGCFRKFAQDGNTNLPTANMMWGAEMSIDLDMASAICPNCRLAVVESVNDDPNNLFNAIQTAWQKIHANVISNSWVTHEYAGENGQLGHLANTGAAIVAAAGDWGYGPAWPAAASSVISVGGTTLLQDPSTSRGWSESVWSGSGSGCSAYVPKPSWQSDNGCKNRTLNDVAAIADPNPGVAVFDTFLPLGQGGWLVFGGTSVATPIVAGAIALAGNGSQLSSASYIAKHASMLNAITQGSNGSCSAPYLCAGGPGYNGPAGYGTPNGVGAL